jgi:class 3 adenylate cyclase/tetratricopeptide (TPR) repeat protein
MTFDEILAQVVTLLQRQGRVSYPALKRRFNLDEAYLDDLKAELIEAQRVAIDEGGRVLVWAGNGGPPAAPTSQPVPEPAPAPLSYTPPHLAEKILTSRSALEGERKQVTVLFADLKGSMELLADRDPEEARQLLDPVLEHMMAAVHRYEGTVNQVMGDGIMALFGAPIAHEDHAQRACYAALAMQAAVQQYAVQVRRTHGVPLHIRVGLNSGEVVVRAIGNDLHMDYTAVGQTTHLAARMEQMAMPGSILVTPDVVRLAEGYVAVTPLGPMAIKGLSTPLEVYEVAGAGPVRTRLQAAAARGLTRFVGRVPEFEALRTALEQAGDGRGQVVALMGEPGVGKSRLVYEFTRSHRTHGWLLLEASSVSYGKATAYLPVIDLLKTYCGIDTHDEPRRRREKVAGKLLTLDEALRTTLPAVLSLLDVPVDDPTWQALDPPQRRQRTLEALKRILLRESQGQPLLLVFEDLHWIDTETQALLDSLVESLPTARVLLLVNYRPEYQHAWGSKTYYTQLRLDPLPAASAEALLQSLLGEDPGLQGLKQGLIERTAGNPLFLEESVRTLVETQGLVGERGAYRLAQPTQSLQVPATVQAVLAARIDRLPPEGKRLLQTAAVIGTEVPLPLLEAIAELPREELHRHLAQLQTAEFLYELRLFPDLEYTFKHALTHEVAYGSLLQERRRALHARLVAAIETRDPERLHEHVERLAHHALRGEVWEKAVTYCRGAGAKALERSAYHEAVAGFEQALEGLTHLPECVDTLAQAIDLRLDLYMTLLPLGDLRRMGSLMHKAGTLAATLQDQQRLAIICIRQVQNAWAMGDAAAALPMAEQATALAEGLGEVALLAAATMSLGFLYHALGHYVRALGCFRHSMALQARGGHHPHFPYVAIVSRAYAVLCLAERGEFAEATGLAHEAVRLSEQLDNPWASALVCFLLGSLALCQGEVEAAVRPLEQGLELCRRWSIHFRFPHLATTLGLAYLRADRVGDALSLLEQATATHGMDVYALCLLGLSEASLRLGRLEEATQQASHALAYAREHGEHGSEAYALKLLGDLAAHGDPPQAESAEASYRQAITLADELGMRPLVAHCHLGLGALYARVGRPEEAGTELGTALALYHSMEMRSWAGQAEAALARLTSGTAPGEGGQ